MVLCSFILWLFALWGSFADAFVGQSRRTVTSLSAGENKNQPTTRSRNNDILFSPWTASDKSRNAPVVENDLMDRLLGLSFSRDIETTTDTTFKPTGSDQTWLGPLQGYANGIEAKLDDVSDWILAYSDLRPDTEQSVAGQVFLATNLAYAAAGLYLTTGQPGDPLFGLLTEVTAAASYAYHYGQLKSQGMGKLPSVRLALLIDYVLAFTSIGVALYYLATSASAEQFLTVLPPAILSLAALGASWIWVQGRPYMVLHGLWHFLSAYTGYLVGEIHAAGVSSL